MEFSVVIPTYRRPDALRAIIASISACEPGPVEVIVVDGDPESGAREALASLPPRVAVRHLSTPLGVTHQRNRGIDEARGDVIVFLDDDVAVDRGTFAILADAYRNPAVVGATGRLVEPGLNRRVGMHSRLRRFLPGGGAEGTFTRYGYPRYLLNLDRPRDVELMPGCFMSARRELAARVRFDEGMRGYALGEDEDFSYRLSRLGRIVYLPGIVVEHKKLGFRSHDSRAFGRLVVRNRAYLFRKNFPQTALARTQFALFPLVLVAHRLVNREWRGALGVLEGTANLRRSRP